MHPTRKHLAHDTHRPCYHYLPPANWMNDPNGLIQWNDTYHLFYQYNPDGAYHGNIHWGHATSPDLVHWEDLPIALNPAEGEHDQDGCWSGCAVNNNGVPTFFYSGVHPQVVCIATSTDNLLTWQKYPGNPVIAGPPPELDTEGEFRDPYVWQEPDGWYMAMAVRSAGDGAVLLYRSDDLINWEYLHTLLRGNKLETEPFWTGTIWECPNFFKLGNKHALIVSFQEHESLRLLYAGYFVGSYKNHHFSPTKQALVDYGGSFYAPQVMQDEQGRYLMWGWLREGRSVAAQKQAGWSGVMSLPRVLSMGDDDVLHMSPVPELAALRGEVYTITDVALTPETPNLLAQVSGDAQEILIDVELDSPTIFNLAVRRTPDGTEQTLISYNAARQELTVDAGKSSLNPDVNPEPVTVSHPLVDGKSLNLRVFIDASVIEIFANERTCLTTRIYPTRPDSTGLRIFTQNGTANVRQLSVWQMNSIWD